ncbi:MAG: hypothetical protein WCT20_03785 [Candidatus Babeliales bacterium]
MKKLSDGFMMLVVVVVMAFLSVVATGLWYTMSLQADILYERERHIKNEIIAEQIMRQAIDFVTANGTSFFSQRVMRRLPLDLTLDDCGGAEDGKKFVVTVAQDKHKSEWPTLLVTVQMLKKDDGVVMVRCLLSHRAPIASTQQKQGAYVVHHYTFGDTL